jgi:hypothetical protein
MTALINTEVVRDSMLSLYETALCVFVAVMLLLRFLLLRRLRAAIFTAVTFGVAILAAAAIYFRGVSHTLPDVAILDSFDRPASIQDMQDPQKLFKLIQAQRAALVQVVYVGQSVANVLYIVTMNVALLGIACLFRMKAAQKESECFVRGELTTRVK